MESLDLISLVTTGLAFFIVAVSPGPATISNATIAMSHGRHASVSYSFGLSTGLVFWGVIAASGMGSLLQDSLYLLIGLKVFGGLYLLWLAFSSARSAWHPSKDIQHCVNNNKWFLNGLLLNLSNPKSVLAWMAALSVGLDVNDSLYAIVTATVMCMIIGFVVNFTYSIVFSMNGMMAYYKNIKRKIDGAVAVMFALAGFGLLRSVFTR